MIRIPKLKAEHFFGMFLILFWGQDILFSYISAFLARIPYLKYLADYTIPTIMFVCLFFAIPYFTKSVSWHDVMFAIIVGIVFIFHFLLFPENESLGSISTTFYFKIFPLYFIGLRFEIQKYWKSLYIMSVINILAFAVYYVLWGSNTVDVMQAEYASYMHRAYTLLPQLLVVTASVFQKPTQINTITGAIGLVLLLMCGNRGSVLLLLLFVALCILFILEKKKRSYVYIALVSIFGVLFYYYDLLINVLTLLFTRIGMSTRIFERFADGTFFQSTARNAIREELSYAISEKPFWGHGLTYDRTITGSYSHNYAFELWVSFGVIFGSILLVATIYVIIAAWTKSSDKTSKLFLLALICAAFLKLFISSSFLQEGLFFMLLGVCISQIRKSKSNKGILKEARNESL